MTSVAFMTLAGLILLNVPISIALGSAAVALMVTSGAPLTALQVVAQRMFTSVDSFPFMAIPFFILSGDLMERGGLSERLISFMRVFFSKLPASLAIICIVSSAFFSAISGSNPATVAAIGAILIPAMLKAGYPADWSAAIASSAGTLGVIIPPGISLVTYGVIANVSIGDMFLAGWVPGIIMAIAMIILSIFTCAKYEKKEYEKITLALVWKEFKYAFWALLMPVVILGGIYSGLFTPTEAAAVSVVYAFIVAVFVYKGITWAELPPLIAKSSVNTALVLFTMALCSPFTWNLGLLNIPAQVASAVLDTMSNKFLVLLVVNIIVLLMGCFMDAQSIILLMTPMLLPIGAAFGLNPLALGIIICCVTSIGTTCPPMGLNNYVAIGIAHIEIGQITRRIIPFIIVEFISVMIMTYIPVIITFLPDWF